VAVVRKRHSPIVADRSDRTNRRYRLQLEHPWLMAVALWLFLFIVVALPVGIGILVAGGIPPGGAASPETVFSWTGSEAKGRSSALVVVSLLGVALAILAVWGGFRGRRERDEVRRLDAERVSDGVPPST